MPNAKSISIILPIKNAKPWIEKCLNGIIKQKYYDPCEIIVIDSGSLDGSLDIVQNYPVRLIQIDPNNFDHGLTRNLGVIESIGEYVIMTVQDAHAYDDNWIKKMLDVFEDPNVMAVCGKQIVPHDIDKNPIEWYRPQSKGEIVKYKFTKEEFDSLSPQEKLNVCSWDDVTAMYRRSALMEIPFQKTSYAEDAIWAKEAILKGYTIAYQPEAMVYHYHLENSDFTFKRTLTTFYFRYKQFGYKYAKPKKTIIDWLRIINTLRKSKPLSMKQRFEWFLYNRQQHFAAVKAYNVFTEALSKSEDELDRVHSLYCGKPPIPSKPKNAT